jgi:hypothetical protein
MKTTLLPLEVVLQLRYAAGVETRTYLKQTGNKRKDTVMLN